MTDSGAGPVARNAGIISPPPLPAASRPAAALSFLTIGASCIALMQLDVPLLKFLRTLDLSSVQWAGDLGEKVGNGASLVAVSLCFLGFGWVTGWKHWMQAGVESLLAHGVVGLLVNGLKHLVGRPRPRFTHSGEWQWWPSWESGWDSFPSGHTSATFAVATVLATHWPRVGWLTYGLATWVAMSRVWRGSHFATDVVAGMVAGVVVGAIFARPLREWRETLLRAIVRITPIAVIATSMLWLVLHRVSNIWLDRLLTAVGLILVAAGLLIRFGGEGGTSRPAWRPVAYRTGIVLVAVGLAFMSGSVVLVTIAALAASAWWIHARSLHFTDATQAFSFFSRRGTGYLYVLGVLLVAVLILELKGMVPIR